MPHPDSLTYGVDDVPPPAKLLLLGLQQALILAIYLVMVTIVVRAAGGDAACSHLLQALLCSRGTSTRHVTAHQDGVRADPTGSVSGASYFASSMFWPSSATAFPMALYPWPNRNAYICARHVCDEPLTPLPSSSNLARRHRAARGSRSGGGSNRASPGRRGLIGAPSHSRLQARRG